MQRVKRQPQVFPVDAADEPYLKRAVEAWYRSGGGQWPSNDSAIEEHDGKHYAVLRNGSGILAVYLIRTDGGLRRVKSWPDLEE